MTPRRSLVAANWKMNGSLAANEAWLKVFLPGASMCEVVVCPPAPYLAQVGAGLAGGRAQLGAQDVSERAPGAFTGDIAAEMLVELKCGWVIVGHSERRQMHAESNLVVAAKAARALQAGLRPIVCVGESLSEREAGTTQTVVSAQLTAVLEAIGAAGLAHGALAYEPVWAIGTGRTATPAQAQEIHAALRAQVEAIDPVSAAALRILYGGSVKPANAAELFSQTDIDGGLIGGASLIAADFLAICAAAA